MEQGFFERVYAVVRRVPKGRVISYGEIAKILGCPRAARQVGWAMRQSPDDIPWQRVVKADGAVAGGEHAELRRALLEAEGVGFLPDGRVHQGGKAGRPVPVLPEGILYCRQEADYRG